MAINTELLEHSFSLAYRETRESVWRKLAPFVDATEAADGVKVGIEADAGCDVSKEVTEAQAGDLGEFLFSSAAEAAVLPEKLVFLALAGQADTDLVESASDLWAPDGRPAVDHGERFKGPGQIIALRPGTDPNERDVIRDAFTEARRRLWDACVYGDGWLPEEIPAYTVIHGLRQMAAMRDALDLIEGPARIGGSRVERWPNPRVEDGAWYVIAHAPHDHDRKKPFAWKVTQAPRLTLPGVALSMRAVFEVRDPFAIVRVEPSSLVLVGPAPAEGQSCFGPRS